MGSFSDVKTKPRGVYPYPGGRILSGANLMADMTATIIPIAIGILFILKAISILTREDCNGD